MGKRRAARQAMFQVVVVQLITVVLVAGAAWAWAGAAAGFTALLGGLACALPNGLFALNLALLSQRARTAQGNKGSAAFALPILLGEFCKVALTAGLLALVVWGYKDVIWLALIVSVGAVLLIQPVALAWPHRAAGAWR